ncbi:MAG: thioredoxin [Bacteroidales bacterium]|nr:thioredoxin [Bacteroidales bacterium]
MKNSILIFLLLTAGMLVDPSCSFAQETNEESLTVYYFHNTRRCATCNAIEEKTKETLENNFHGMMEKGKIKFVVLNAEEDENEAIVEKYEIWGSSLLLVKKSDGNERVENLTDFAFANARTNPDKFVTGLQAEIEKMIR